jgi:AraC-like DNA-binding protein
MSDRLVFSTDALPERDRFAIWCEEILGRYPHCHITTHDRAGFRATIALQRFGAVDIKRSSSSAAEFSRTRDLLRDGDDTLLVGLLERGAAGHQTQVEVNQELAVGDGVICDCAYVGSMHVATDAQFWVLKIPRQRITALLPGVKDFCGARLNRDDTARRLLFRYLDGLSDDESPLAGGVARLCEEHIVGLVALALGAEGEARYVIEHQYDVRAARRAAILDEIGTYLRDPRLAAPAVAARLGITPRYLRKLLEQTGKSFSEHLLDKRLERAAALLRDPQQSGARIADLAYACGFNDLSYFNRVFRRRYGLTPSDMRAAVLGDSRKAF